MRRVIYLLLGMCIFANVSAEDVYYDYATNFLAEKGIISESDNYSLDSNITRREMLKVMMNLSGKEISEDCTGKFQDFSSSDWGCKYAEAALTHGYIAANKNFRPNDFVTNIEALKMIMQAKNIPKATEYKICFEENCSIEKWENAYIEGSKDFHLISIGGDIKINNSSYFVESDYALRSRVFMMASRTYNTFKDNISYWRMYGDDYFSIKYPEYWITTGEYNSNFISFGDFKNFPGGLDFGVSRTKEDFETYLAKIGKQFPDRKTEYQDIETDAGLQGKMGIVTTEKYPNWISKTVFFETEKSNYAISGNGAREDPYFQNFYKSFRLQEVTFDDEVSSEEFKYSGKKLLNSDGFSIEVPLDFIGEDSSAHSLDYDESRLGAMTSGVYINFWQSSHGIRNISDSKSGAKWFFDLTQDCVSCDIDEYAKIEQVGDIFFALDKVRIDSDMNMGGDIENLGISQISYTAKTVINEKIFRINVSYILGQQDEKEMENLFESVLFSFSK